MKIKEIIFTLLLCMVSGLALESRDYFGEVRNPENRSYSYFRMGTSSGIVQHRDRIELDLLSGWIATTTATLMTITAANGCPDMNLAPTTGQAEIVFPDVTALPAAAVSVAGALVKNVRIPENWVTGTDLSLVINAKAEQNVSSPTFLVIRISINGAALTNVGSVTTQVTSASYTDYNIDLTDLAGVSTLAAGDNVAVLIHRGEKVTTVATATITIRDAELVYNKLIPFSW